MTPPSLHHRPTRRKPAARDLFAPAMAFYARILQELDGWELDAGDRALALGARRSYLHDALDEALHLVDGR